MVRHCDFHLLCLGRRSAVCRAFPFRQRGVTVKIEGITVCVQYADFFAETIDRMCHAVDQLFVVTTADDKDTQKLCLNRPKITVVETDAFYRDGMTFSVGAGVNEGLKACNRDNWVLVLDADTALPWHTREALEFADLDPRKLYGVDRATAWGRTMWDAVKGMDQYQCPLVVSPPLRLSLRVSFPQHGGWFPCGYFNLWYPGVSGIHDYPIHPGRDSRIVGHDACGTMAKAAPRAFTRNHCHSACDFH